jgi:hypothetical protein
VTERSKARVCGRSLVGIAGSNPARVMDVYVVCLLSTKDNRQKPGQSGQRENRKNPSMGEISAPVQAGPASQPVSYTTGIGSLSRG